MTSIQLRRYQLAEGTLADWVAHWNENVVGLRQEYGFKVLFAYADHVNEQFVWALSYAGTPDELIQRAREYQDSPEWKVRNEGKTSGILQRTVEVVEQVWPLSVGV